MQYDELTLNSAEKIRDTIENLEEFFQKLEEEDVDYDSTGDISSYLIARTDRERSEIPSYSDINLTLGFLDFHDVMEMRENNPLVWSDSAPNHFNPDTYDDDRKEEKLDNLKNKIEEHQTERTRISNSEELDFSDV